MGILDLVRPYEDKEEETADKFTYDIEIDDVDIQPISRELL